MQGDLKVIEFLNHALTNELTAVNQYWLHYRLLHHWGLEKLAAFERSESIDEMKHADTLAERILVLDGLPNFQAIGRIKVGENVAEVLRADLALEMEAIPLLKEAVAHSEAVRDYVSREIFERILENEENHVDVIETQLELIERMGLSNYILLNSAPIQAE
jgi:bacterioferritin